YCLWTRLSLAASRQKHPVQTNRQSVPGAASVYDEESTATAKACDSQLTSHAWEATALPLSYTRASDRLSVIAGRRQAKTGTRSGQAIAANVEFLQAWRADGSRSAMI